MGNNNFSITKTNNMTPQEALKITKQVFDAAIKTGMFSTIEDASALTTVYQCLQQNVSLSSLIKDEIK